jgi:hypothetical protein
MKLCALIACGAVALGLAAPAGLAAPKRADTKVVCLSGTTLKRQYRERPKSCVFHRRHAPLAEAFFVRTRHDRWQAWQPNRAKGKGKEIPSMGGPTPVKIRLSKPVNKCGHRVFSKAHFVFPKIGSSGALKLDTCAPS